MNTDDRPDTRVAKLEEMPDPLGGAVRERLTPGSSIRLLAFSSSQTSLGVRSPATLLAVTDCRWLLASDDDDGRVTVDECTYDDTLLVELTEILLYGRLKIDFVSDGEHRANVVEFNTVDDRLYREAVLEILRKVEGDMADAPGWMPMIGPATESWPVLLRNAAVEALPQERRLAGVIQWPAITGGFGRELAPAAALLVTDHELLHVSEERAWARGPTQAKYGSIATFFPLARLAGFAVHGSGPLSILDLRMHASHGGETLQILIPTERESEVSQVVQCALRR